MKVKLFLTLIVLFISISSTALAAPIVEIRPVDTVLASPGDSLDFNIYLVNDDSEWGMYLYAYSLWIDPDELEYVGFDYGNPPEWTEHMPYDGARNDEDTGFETWYGSFNSNNPDYSSYTLAPNEELLITTLHTTVINPLLDGEWDVVLKYYEPMGENFFDSNYQAIQLVQADGPDVAPVPIPSALLLLGSGIISLIGIRRRKS
ncbi:MAG: hypothetical protein HGJ97_19325 [Desulfosporosinus sp.]|nr:hypothetical protein [Desulfosporosinus sp.]